MEGSFACPECGTFVEVHGLAPGRQVRCGFCNRLLEVPYLPRAADSLLTAPSLRQTQVAPLGVGRPHGVVGRDSGGRKQSVSSISNGIDPRNARSIISSKPRVNTRPTASLARR